MAVHAARIGDHLGGFVEKGLRSRGSILDGGKGRRRSQLVSILRPRCCRDCDGRADPDERQDCEQDCETE
jgi:hypothetical protein